VLERQITTAILRALNKLPGCYARKTFGGAYGGAGWPDIVACYKGRLFMLEVKRPGGKATPLQLRELERWAATGARCRIVTSVFEAMEFVEGLNVRSA
jgi:sulfite reductase beta subunit-like hemoprotein